jgi:hypothetical protein
VRSLWKILLFVSLATVASAEEITDVPDALNEDVTNEGPAPRRFEMTPQVSVVSISALSIPIPGYVVNYTPTIEGLPTFQITLGRPIAELGRFTLSAQVGAGYGARSGAFATHASGLGSAVTSENITLRWIPLSASLRVAYRPITFPYLRPSVMLGFGSLALIQTSDNPALNRSIGIPMVVVAPQITFMDGGSRHWLGGFSFGLTMLRGLGGDSALAATSLDLSLNILL